MTTHSQAAPAELEDVRRFINTWFMPNQTRIETDLLPVLISDPKRWEHEVSAFPLHPLDSLDTLLALRRDLRRACADHRVDDELLNPWFELTPLIAQVESSEGGRNIHLEPIQPTYASYIVAKVANAIGCSSWSRLKTCDDCQWAFYDHTRSATKRWCGMTKGSPEGRACGTIAKVRAFRERKAAQAR